MKPSIKSLKPSIKLPLAEEQVNKKIKSEIKEHTQKETDKIIREINRKTIIYFVLSITGLFLIFVPLPPFIFYSLVFITILITVYLIKEFIKAIKKIFDFINSFDTKIKAIVENKIEKEKEQSLKNRIGFQLSGHDTKSLENLFISYSVRELVYQFKKKKQFIVTRIVAYIVAAFLFHQIFINFFTNL